MKSFSSRFIVWISALIIGTGVGGEHAQAEVSFAGKKIELLVPFKAGGGTDRWARFWAPLIAERLPGKPKIEVRNIVGGGSTKGANQFARTAQDDGLTLLASSVSVLFPYLLGDSRVEYDFTDWQAMLISGTGGVVVARPEFVDDADNLIAGQNNRILLQGPSQMGALLMMSMEILGLEYSADFGASGSSAKLRSLDMGLTDVDIETTIAYLNNVIPLIDDGKAKVVFSLGMLSENGEIVRDTTFPQYPTFIEYYQKHHNGDVPSGVMFDVWREFFEAGFPSQKMLIVPNNIDPEVKQAYITAIEDIIDDESVMPPARKEVLGKYAQYTGDTAQKLMRDATQISPTVRDWYKNWVKEKFKITI